MDYQTDVKETQRRWKVKDPHPNTLDLRLNLRPGDQLVFEDSGTMPGKITRRRSGSADTQWGFNCVFTDGGTDSGSVVGKHLAANGPEITINFFRNTITNKMEYNGTVAFTSPTLTSGTWMADEGP